MRKRGTALLLMTVLFIVWGITGCGYMPGQAPAQEETAEEAAEETAAQEEPEVPAEPETPALIDNGDTLVIALQQGIRSLDPAKASDQASLQIGAQIWESLLTYDSSGALAPNLASSWQTEDGLTYVYQIRDDILFSDGEPMTMEDVLFSLERNFAPELHSVYKQIYSNVQGISQTGDWELTVKLRSPDPAWQHAMASGAGAVIEKAFVEEQGRFGEQGTGVIGTGPYRFESWEKGAEIVLVRNEHYREEPAPESIAEVRFRLFRDEVMLLSQLRSGEVDLCVSPPQETLKAAAAMEHLQAAEVPSQTCLYLALNCRNSFLSDPEVRAAIALSIDKEKLFEGIMEQTGRPAVFSLPFSAAQYGPEVESWSAFAEELSDPEKDPERAREILEEKAGSEDLSLRLFFKGTPARNVCANYIAEALEEVGIEVSLEELTGPEMSNYQYGVNRDYDLLLLSWEARYPDPAASVYPLLSASETAEGGSNASRYSNAEAEKLLQQQKSSSDPAERTELLQEALRITSSETPLIALCYASQYVIANERIDYAFSPLFVWNFRISDIRIR